MKKTYAVYDSDDNLVMVGDMRQVAEYTGYTTTSLYSLVCRMRKGTSVAPKYRVYEVEDE